MGSKFANLQIQYVDPLIVKEIIPGCTVKEFSRGWVTVLHEDFQIGTIEREAYKLSKNLDRPILSVGYYDDDILVLRVYKQGKSVAYHVSNDGYGYESRTGNPTHFQQSLGLEEKDTSVIKEILKCENLEKKVVLLENLLGVTLWINYRSFEEYEKELSARVFDKSIIYEYIDELKAAGRVKNHTELKMRAEIEAIPEWSCDECFRLPDANGDFILNNSDVFKIRMDGNYEPTIINQVGTNSRENSILHLLPDGATVQTSYEHNQHSIFQCDSTGHMKWKLEVDFIKVPPVLHNDHLYMHVDINAVACILKINREGEIVSRFEAPTWGGCHWKTFLIDHQNRIFYCCTLDQNGERQARLFCFNEDLAVLEQRDLDGTSFDFVMDHKLGFLYIYIHLKEIIKIDVTTVDITGRLKCTDYVKLVFVDRKNRVYIQKGESTLELMSPVMQIVSRHRLKGQIQWHDINFEGNPCFVTWNGRNWDSGKEKSLLRVFEITE
ncbi:hypothetical protein [Paenibacillus sp. BK720]|uniref:hypothetical protein n=1 Tax=Paenibacillus sp. BK720 TaxID=2587092 RepID=UPI001422BEA9|nr:hypothetical protein [Paenibacillus sp. BK720]NIK72070.1 hypothetical protein [Paenibacillus sp. BK720]